MSDILILLTSKASNEIQYIEKKKEIDIAERAAERAVKLYIESEEKGSNNQNVDRDVLIELAQKLKDLPDIDPNCAYFGMQGDEKCEGCPAHGVHVYCTSTTLKDVASRIMKALDE